MNESDEKNSSYDALRQIFLSKVLTKKKRGLAWEIIAAHPELRHGDKSLPERFVANESQIITATVSRRPLTPDDKANKILIADTYLTPVYNALSRGTIFSWLGLKPDETELAFITAQKLLKDISHRKIKSAPYSR